MDCLVFFYLSKLLLFSVYLQLKGNFVLGGQIVSQKTAPYKKKNALCT